MIKRENPAAKQEIDRKKRIEDYVKGKNRRDQETFPKTTSPTARRITATELLQDTWLDGSKKESPRLKKSK